jgi:hypothetical protein
MVDIIDIMDNVLIKIIDTMVPDYKDMFGITDSEIITSFNEFIKSMPAPIPKAFKIFLYLFNIYPLFFKFRRLEDLNRDQRRKIILNWAGSKLYVKRAMLASIKTFIMLVFYSNENVEKRLGFERKCRID